MTRFAWVVVGIIVAANLALLACGIPALSATTTKWGACAVYDPRANVGTWYANGGAQAALFVDRGDASYWVRNQERVAFYAVPRRLTRIVEAWPIVGSNTRATGGASCRTFTRRTVRAIRMCNTEVGRGNAYTAEMFDQCVADAIDAQER